MLMVAPNGESCRPVQAKGQRDVFETCTEVARTVPEYATGSLSGEEYAVLSMAWTLLEINLSGWTGKQSSWSPQRRASDADRQRPPEIVLKAVFKSVSQRQSPTSAQGH